ncbi:MAG: hypothetical protein FWC55_04270 [Firmicutes bacterium]|nr:hypothetical protein [Bacillota bacterium]
MKVADKLAYFRETLNREADEERKRLDAEADEALLAAAEAASKEAERRAEKKVRSEVYKVSVEKNRRIAAATAAAKKAAVETRSHLINGIFANAARTAEEFTKTDLYSAWLNRNVPGRAKQYPGATVILMERDRAAAAGISAAAPESLVFEFTDDDFIGGFRIFLPERSAVLDCTFRSRLNDEKKTFDKLRISFEGLETEEA